LPFFHVFPSKGIAKALMLNIDNDYKSIISKKVYAEAFQQEKDITKFGDAHPLDPQ